MSGFFSKLRVGLRKTSQAIEGVFGGDILDVDAFEELEDALIATDMGSATAHALIVELKQAPAAHRANANAAKEWLAEKITQRLNAVAAPFLLTYQPAIVLVLGVNGNGKTTTIGKLAQRYMAENKRVMMVAADTFRAAAVEQLQLWARTSGADFFRGEDKADPASVVYAGVEKAVASGVDMVLIDTAGRLHTKQNLMDELHKITRVIQKIIPDAPHHVLLVLDATTGQNALAQAKAFHEIAGITGLVITKLDGTAKAGMVVALADQFSLPVHFIGVGEGAEDLLAFNAAEFSCALIGIEPAQPSA